MARTIYQHGDGDNVAGDKIMGSKVTNNNPGANIANLVNEAKDNAQVNAANVSQTSGTSNAELLQIIGTLRQTAAQLPQAVQEDIIIEIDDVEAEVKKPEDQRNMPRLRKRLMGVVTAATFAASGVGAANDLVENANGLVDRTIELGAKVGIELPRPADS